jgi:hypothetical protein
MGYTMLVGFVMFAQEFPINNCFKMIFMVHVIEMNLPHLNICAICLF